MNLYIFNLVLSEVMASIFEFLLTKMINLKMQNHTPPDRESKKKKIIWTSEIITLFLFICFY